jgi:hypothetical protein
MFDWYLDRVPRDVASGKICATSSDLAAAKQQDSASRKEKAEGSKEARLEYVYTVSSKQLSHDSQGRILQAGAAYTARNRYPWRTLVYQRIIY